MKHMTTLRLGPVGEMVVGGLLFFSGAFEIYSRWERYQHRRGTRLEAEMRGAPVVLPRAVFALPRELVP